MVISYGCGVMLQGAYFGNSCRDLWIYGYMMQAITSVKLSHGLVMTSLLRVGVGVAMETNDATTI